MDRDPAWSTSSTTATFRPDPAVRRPGLRPSVLRLLGGRRPRLEGGPPGLAAAVAGRRRRRTAPRGRGRPTRSSPTSRPKAPAANPFATSRPEPVPDARRGRRRRRPDNPFAPPPRERPTVDRRRAAQAPAARARPGRGRQLRQGAAARRRARGLRAVRAADRVPPGAAHARPLPGAAGLAAAGGHHLHRHDRRGAPAGPRPAGSWRPSATTSTARGFAAVETYPEVGARPDATSAATPGVLGVASGSRRAIDDARFPVMRRELG